MIAKTYLNSFLTQEHGGSSHKFAFAPELSLRCGFDRHFSMTEPADGVGGRKRRVELDVDNRMTCFDILHHDSENGNLKSGQVQKMAHFFDVDRKTIGRLHKKHAEQLNLFLLEHAEEDDIDESSFLLDRENFHNGCHGKRGRNKKWDRTALKQDVRKIPKSKRKNVRSLADETGIPRSTIHRMLKEDRIFKRHTSSLRPALTEENKVSRMLHALDHISHRHFLDMCDRVHIDEKWFNITKDGETCILVAGDDADDVDDEEPPDRRVRHKSHIMKVMFLCAQARPRWDTHTDSMWDGEIGMWPIGEWAPAQKDSVNRPAGTMEWKDLSVTKERHRNILLCKVYPAIQSKWPKNQWNNNAFKILVQHDGARAHFGEEDELCALQMNVMGLKNKIALCQQPANSPDTNINDLGLFRALQTMAWKKTADDIPNLIQNVMTAHLECPTNRINRVWLTLMSCLNETIKHGGDNDYKIPHMNKDRLERNGQLPVTLAVTPAADQCLHHGEE